MREPREIIKNGRTRWLVDLREFGAGRRFFASKAAALTFQTDTLAETERHGQLAFDLPHETRTRWLAAERTLLTLGATIEQAVASYVASHRPGSVKPLGEAVKACLAAKEAAGRRKRSVQQLTYTLRSFVVAVGADTLCSDVTPDHVERWLDNPKWAARTRKGRLIDLRTFFAFAIRRGWARTDPGRVVEPITLDEGPPGILTVPQVRRLLEATRKHRPAFLPFIVLGVFCGVRPDEIKQLSWAYVNLQTGYVEIPAAIAKRVKGGSRQRRLIKLQPNAIEWLQLAKDRCGELPPVGWQDRWDVVRKAAGFAVSVKRKGRRIRAKGDVWPKNAMRHSFCSYTLPIFGELKESEWAGHSPAVAIQRYRELVTEEAAREFWAVRPTAG